MDPSQQASIFSTTQKVLHRLSPRAVRVRVSGHDGPDLDVLQAVQHGQDVKPVERRTAVTSVDRRLSINIHSLRVAT